MFGRIDLKSETRFGVYFGAAGAPSGAAPVTGRALSLALRLKNKNKGAAQTQIPKNVAISVKPATPFGGGAPRKEWVRLCLASWDNFAKWKNQRKWSAMTNTQEPMNEREVREMRGQVWAKFCR
jgi:hypothetical protein